jgi:hypothetical protein
MPYYLSAMSSDRLPIPLPAFTLVPLMLSLLAGCSVLEDRSECPCILDVDLTDVAENLTGQDFPIVISAASEAGFRRDTVPLSAFEAGRYLLPVKKWTVDVCLVHGAPEGWTEGVMLIAEGFECPPLMMYSERIEAVGETVGIRPVLRKNYCRLEIVFKGAESVWRSNQAVIEGPVCGYGPAGELLEGPFSVLREPGGDGRCTVNLPRQKDSSLMLKISSEGGRARRYFAIGNYLEEAGYDWAAPDLEDVVIEVDYAVVTLLPEPVVPGEVRMEILI